MKPIILPMFLVVLFSVIVSSVASADDGPSAEVQLSTLSKGSLPQIVTVYGSIGTASSARETIMAPLQAEVTDSYVRNGALVMRGAPLLRLIPTPATQLAYTQAKSQLSLATALDQRIKAMVAGHLATDDQLYQSEKDLVDAHAQLTALTAQGADGPHTLFAPFDAVITVMNVTPGSIVAQGDSLLQLAKPTQLELDVGVIPNTAGLINVGDPVQLSPIGGGSPTAGKVVFRGALVDSTNGLVEVDITAPSERALLGEMFRADITVRQNYGFIVSHDAVLVNNNGETYVVQNDNMTAKLVTVKVLASVGDQDVISGPLKPDGAVILAGAYQLNDGDKIRVSDSKGNAGQ